MMTDPWREKRNFAQPDTRINALYVCFVFVDFGIFADYRKKDKKKRFKMMDQ